MALHKTAPEFQATITRISEAAQKSPESVYALWRSYSQACHASDQSPVLGEFIDWHTKDLGNNRQALLAAITN